MIPVVLAELLILTIAVTNRRTRGIRRTHILHRGVLPLPRMPSGGPTRPKSLLVLPDADRLGLVG
nr:hypothetical protein OG999_46785 [Streptomyces sp. NBC_00886]